MYTKRDNDRDNAKLVAVLFLVGCVAVLGYYTEAMDRAVQQRQQQQQELDRAIQEGQQAYWDCMVQQARLRRTPELCRELR